MPMLTAIRIAALLSVLGASLGAFGQPVIVVDYRISLLESHVPYPGGEVWYTPNIEADWWTTTLESFVVRMTYPAGLTFIGPCDEGEGKTTHDPAARRLTWADRLDNPHLAQKSCPMRFRIDPALATGSVYSLSATLTTEKPDPNPANNEASHTAVVIAASDLEVTGSSDVRQLRPGDTVTYTFSVKNHGPQDAREVMVENRLSPHVTFLSLEQVGGPVALLDPPTSGMFVFARIPFLPFGSTATFRIVVRATPSSEAADIVNRVEARSSSYDLADRNNELFVLTHAGPRADLGIATRRVSVRSELRIPLTIHVANDGPDTVQNVVVRNSIHDAGSRYDFIEHVKYVSATPSQGTCSAPTLESHYVNHYPQAYWALNCSVGTLVPGGKATIRIVIERTTPAVTFQHLSLVTPGQNDPNAANNASRVDLSGTRRRLVRR